MRFFSATILSAAAAAGILFASTVTAALHAITDSENSPPLYGKGQLAA
jgi:hypothetical protein